MEHKLLVVFLCVVAIGCGDKREAAPPPPDTTTTTPSVRHADSTPTYSQLVSDSLVRDVPAEHYRIDIVYPRFVDTAGVVERGFNALVRKHVDDEVAAFMEGVGEMEANRDSTEEAGTSELDENFEIITRTPKLISVLFRTEDYSAGAAHPNSASYAINYDVATSQSITLSSLFAPGTQYIRALSDYSLRDLYSQLDDDADSTMVSGGAGPDPTNFQTFSLVRDSLIIHFDPYQVAPYAAGPQSVSIPFKALPGFVDRWGLSSR